MIGAAHHDGKAVARGIFGEVLVGNRRVLPQPVFGREAFEGGGELAIDLSPRFLKVGSRDWIVKRSIRVCDVGLIPLGVESVAEAEQWKHAIMHGSQMTDEVEYAILARGDLLLELLIRERRETLIEAANHEFPGIERGDTEEFFVCHFDLPFLYRVDAVI